MGTTYTVHVFLGVRETLVMRARRESVNTVLVRECPNKHRVEPSWKVCPVCASPVTERQKRSVKTKSVWESYDEEDALIADMSGGNGDNVFVGLSIFSRTPRDESGDGMPMPTPTEQQWKKATEIIMKYDPEAKPSLFLVFRAG